MRQWLCIMALAACGASSPRRSLPPADDPTCPLLVPGTVVEVEETGNGAALVFVTTGDPLSVRARAAALAEMHTKHDGPADALGMRFTPGSTAIATEVGGGARVELSAGTPDGAAAIRKELRMHVTRLGGGSCEM